MTQTYSTAEAAKQAKVHRITLQRWLRDGRVSPSIRVPLKGRTLWRWTKADIQKLRKQKGRLRPGPKAKNGRA
jgi:excisionase family DNA binding protein